MQPDQRSTVPLNRGHEKRPLDTVVKLALGVLFGSFALIWDGMFLSRPDRSIPPYSIGSQKGTAVAVHVPLWASDTEIETLIERFRKVGRETRQFGAMKIQPTTPGHPDGRYQRLMIYIFTQEDWTEPDILRRYLQGTTSRYRKGSRKRSADSIDWTGWRRKVESVRSCEAKPLPRPRPIRASCSKGRSRYPASALRARQRLSHNRCEVIA